MKSYLHVVAVLEMTFSELKWKNVMKSLLAC